MYMPPYPYGTAFSYPAYNSDFYKKEQEKKALRSLSNHSGVALIIVLVAFNFFATFLSFFLLFGGGVMYGASGTGDYDPSMYFAMQGIVSILGMCIPALILCKTEHAHLDDLIHFSSRVSVKRILALLPAGLAVFMISNFAVDLLLQNLEAIGLPYDQSSLSIATDGSITANILYVVSVACVPAFVEEFLFRGVLLGLLRKYGDGFAILISSLLFGLMHGNIVQIPFAFIGGLALAFLVVYTGSIIPAMILHFANNIYSVTGDIIMTQYGALIGNIFYILVMGVTLLLALLGLFLLSRKDKSLFHIEKADSSLTLKERVSAFFLTPGVIIAIVLLIGEAVMTWAMVAS